MSMLRLEPPGITRPNIIDVLGLADGAAASRMKRLRPWLIGAAIAGVLFVVYLYMRTDGQSASGRFVTQPATRSNLTVVVTATGSVEPRNVVDISSELSGTIRRVLVDYNAEVKAGAVLAELDTDKLKAGVASARAKVVAAKARVRDAQATAEERQLEFDRKSELVKRNVSSEHDLETARAAYHRALAGVESAHADVAAAEADLELSETNLAKTCICSPIDGVVLNRNVEPGQTVASSLQAPVLFTIAEDLAQMEVHVDVDEADIGKVREGQSATFSVDAHPDQRFDATIKSLRYGSETIQGVVTYKAVLATDNAAMLLRPGMTATAEITVKELKDALTVPNAALRFVPESTEPTDERSFLQKLLPGRPRLRQASEQAPSGPNRKLHVLVDGAALAVAVRIGATDGQRTEIQSGDLKVGQEVIVDTINTAR